MQEVSFSRMYCITCPVLKLNRLRFIINDELPVCVFINSYENNAVMDVVAAALPISAKWETGKVFKCA